jgi:hypothetical protein
MKIKTHNSNAQYLNTNHFFILAKGNNAGKPMENPCPNCFVLVANNLHEKEYYYWLCYFLWVGGMFRPYLTGSVIEFLRIGELKQVIKTNQSKVQLRREALLASFEILNKLSAHQVNLHKQIQLIKQTKQAVACKIFQSTLPHAIIK